MKDSRNRLQPSLAFEVPIISFRAFPRNNKLCSDSFLKGWHRVTACTPDLLSEKSACDPDGVREVFVTVCGLSGVDSRAPVNV